MDVGITEQICKAFLIALVISLILGPIFIPFLKRFKLGQNIRHDGPSRHLAKAGTPTMGGVIFLVGMIVSLLYIGRSYSEALIIGGITLGFGLIGFLDDFIKIVMKRSLGLRAREKLLGQILLATLLGVLAINLLDGNQGIIIPFSGLFTDQPTHISLNPLFFIIFTIIVVVATSNAVNLTDGLDGLATGVSLVAAVAFAVIGVLSGQPGVAYAMAALAGSCLGFLFFNRHPARVFMGDTGSLALGASLSTAAVLTGTELYLLIIGGIFVLEALSVIIQVFSFQLLGHRVFKMSPLHHHFELVGWSEQKVVYVFWTGALVFALLGLAGFNSLL